MPSTSRKKGRRNSLRASSLLGKNSENQSELKMYELEKKESREKSKELMHPRIDYAKVAPKAVDAMMHLQDYVNNCSLSQDLLELVRIRASQLNGCAYCLDMHSKDARAAEETEQRIYLLNAWREAPFYSDKERAALEWTEAVTLVSKTHVPDKIYNEVSRHFSEQEIIELTMAIIAINSWNRLSISMRHVAGTYQPRKSSAKH
jgi:AhpD family alkylhydroperoxidase